MSFRGVRPTVPYALLGAVLVVGAAVPALFAHPADGSAERTSADAALPPHALPVRPPKHRRAPSPTQLLHFRGSTRGAAVIHAPKVYLVFYGRQWGRATTVAGELRFTNDPSGMAPRLQRFVRGLGGNEHWSTSTTQYCDGVAYGTQTCPVSAARVGHPGTSPLAGVWHDTTYDAVAAPTEMSFRASAVRAARHFHNADAFANASAHYMVVLPPHITPHGFGTLWCAYHSDGSSPVGRVTYTALPYIPDAGVGCGANAVHPGVTGRTDGITMVAGHEYVEWLTDPFGTGWLDARGNENADGCAWVETGGGRPVDAVFPTGTFPVQSLWSNSADRGQGGCVTWFAGTTNQH